MSAGTHAVSWAKSLERTCKKCGLLLPNPLELRRHSSALHPYAPEYKPKTIERMRQLRARFNPPWTLTTERTGAAHDFTRHGGGLFNVLVRVTDIEWDHALWHGRVTSARFVAVADHVWCLNARCNDYNAAASVMIRYSSRVYEFVDHENNERALSRKVALFLVERNCLGLVPCDTCGTAPYEPHGYGCRNYKCPKCSTTNSFHRFSCVYSCALCDHDPHDGEGCKGWIGRSVACPCMYATPETVRRSIAAAANE